MASMVNRANGIIIRGESSTWTADQLQQLFAGFGPIVDVFVKDSLGRRRGYAFVTFADASSVAMAIAGAPSTINEQAITVEARTPARERKEADPSPNIYIKGISEGTTPEQVEAAVAGFGSVLSLDVSDERGFAFVGFETVEEATMVINSQPLFVGGAQTTVEFRASQPRRARRSEPRNDDGGSRTRAPKPRDENSVYLKGCPRECEDDAIAGALAGYGTVTSVSKRDGRDYAFVAFATPEGMHAAVSGGACSVDGYDVTIEARN